MSQNRTNNINRHTQDYAQQVLLNKSSLTRGLQVADNLQDVLNLLGETALKSYQLPISNTQVAGIVRAATQEEVDAGSAQNIYVQPLTLKSTVTKPEATETVKGIARFQTDTDANNINESRTIINPKNLHKVFDTRRATETKAGTIVTSTQSQAETGVDDTQAMTPLRVKQAVAKFTPKVEFATASETVSGYTRLASKGQVQQGTLNVGYAVSPKAFVESRATQTAVGTVQMATNDQALNSSATDLAIQPANLRALITSTASANKPGLVKLTNDVNSSDQTAALAPTARVVPQSRRINGKALDNDINITSGDVNCYNRQESDQRYFGQGVPAGTVVAYAGQNIPNGWIACHGQWLNRHQYPNLFNAIGYTYGGSGDGFHLPETRGEFIRGFDSGRGADRDRRYGSWQKATIACANGADYEGGYAHGLAIGPNFSGQGHWEWERPGERCRFGVYHCRHHPARWVGPANNSHNYSRWQAAQILGGDYVDHGMVQGIFQQAANGGQNYDATQSLANDDRIGSGHVTYGSRPRNITMHYIIKT